MIVNRLFENTDFTTEPKTSSHYPRIINIMPSCHTHADSWQTKHPTHRIISWTQAEIDKLFVVSNLGVLTGVTKDDMALLTSLVVLLHVGGVCVGAPYECKANVETLTTACKTSTLLFGQLGSVDSSLMIAKQGSKLMRNIHQWFTHDSDTRPPLRPMFVRYAQSNAYDCSTYSTATMDKIVVRSYQSYTYMFEKGLSDKVANKTISPLVDVSPDAQQLFNACVLYGALETQSSPWGVVVLDDVEFNDDKVTHSVTFASRIVSIIDKLQPGALVFICNSPATGIALDTFSKNFLLSLGAVELHRSLFVVYQMP